MSEVNMLKSIEPKSDQLNFDDFASGITKTIKITRVTGNDGDQPVSIGYENDQGKPFKPGKSMRRVMVMLWGADAKVYVGRSMTLYGDPDVIFGGVKVGGIRISYMSHIDEPHVLQLTNKKGSKKSFTVRPLKTDAPKPAPTEADKLAAATKKADAIIAEINAAEDVDVVVEKNRDALDRIEKSYPDLNAKINDALKSRENKGE